MAKDKKKSGFSLGDLAEYLPQPFKGVADKKKARKKKTDAAHCRSKGMGYDQSTGKCE